VLTIVFTITPSYASSEKMQTGYFTYTNVISSTAAVGIKSIQEQGYSYNRDRLIDIYIEDIKQNLSLPILTDKKNNRTLYPFRELLESIGATVTWDGEKQLASASLDGTIVQFKLDYQGYWVNGKYNDMDTKAIADPSVGRIYIPIRYAFEPFGYSVIWVESQKHDEIRIHNLGPVSMMTDEEFQEKIYGKGNYVRTNTAYYVFDSENKRLLYRDIFASEKYAFDNHVLSTKYDPYVIEQTYNLVKTLADEERYVKTWYNRDGFAMVMYAMGEGQTNIFADFFNYQFLTDKTFDMSYENTKFSKNVVIDLAIRQLYWGDEYFESRSDPYYVKKLRDSLVAVFGEEQGEPIFEYVYAKYIQNIKSDTVSYYVRQRLQETKTFGNIKVDYDCTDRYINFYFSYLN